MGKIIILSAILVLIALLVFGCNRQPDAYPAGYAAYGQQPYQGYIGGGCAVAGPEPIIPTASVFDMPVSSA